MTIEGSRQWFQAIRCTDLEGLSRKLMTKTLSPNTTPAEKNPKHEERQNQFPEKKH